MSAASGEAGRMAPQTWFQSAALASGDEAWRAYVEPWLQFGDPLADAFLLELQKRGQGLSEAADRLLEPDAPACAVALLAELQHVPEWVDFELMGRGAAMAQRNYPQLIAALTYGALPLVFAHPDSAAVFLATGHFEAGIARRLNESAALFFGATHSAELRPTGRIWSTCCQVWMIHAAVRKHLLKSARWDVAQHGVPINALQTAAGPAFFGACVVRGMRALGARITQDEALGHCMIWRYITYLLGVPAALIAADPSDQVVFDDMLMRNTFAPDDTGRHMVTTLLEGLIGSPPTQRIPRGLQTALMRCMLGEAWADAFAIPRGDPRALRLLQLTLSAHSRLATVRYVSPVARRVGGRVLDRLASGGLLSVVAS